MKQTVQGHAEGPFARLADVFRENLDRHGEAGAAVCVYVDGQKVVDLWGGWRDPAESLLWQEDTVAPLFSTGKGLAAIAYALAVSRGAMRWDDPVAAHWPAFAAKGKQAITIRQILDHTSGLVLFGRAVHRNELADPATIGAIIENMEPAWQPGSRWGYQLATYGELLSEILRRCDAEHRSLSRFFADEIAQPLELQLCFGLPDDLDRQRLAAIDKPGLAQLRDGLTEVPLGFLRQIPNPLSRLHRTFREIPDIDMNNRAWLKLEFPSANGIGDARSVAKLYSALATADPALELNNEVRADLVAPPEVPPDGPVDHVMGVGTSWHLGFTRPSASFNFSPSVRAFGMPGLGGSFGFCDPDQRIGYAYVPNRMGLLPFNDMREQRLRDALYSIVGSGAI